MRSPRCPSCRRKAISPRALSEIPTSYLVDNSVWARLASSAVVADAFRAIIGLNSPRTILICPPIAAEIGHSARDPRDHAVVVAQLSAFPECLAAPGSTEVLALQSRVWNAGLVRAVGGIDILIAAYALKNGAAVLHYDSDFEHLARVEPALSQRWIVPRGTA